MCVFCVICYICFCLIKDINEWIWWNGFGSLFMYEYFLCLVIFYWRGLIYLLRKFNVKKEEIEMVKRYI